MTSSQVAAAIPANARLLSFPGAVLAPGFVDLHIHGASGDDVMEADDDGLRRMASFLAEFDVVVEGLRAESEGRLAGSVLTLDRAVQNVMSCAKWSLQQSIRLATTNPAQVLGESSLGVLKSGTRADITVLSQTGEVLQGFVGGHAVRD